MGLAVKYPDRCYGFPRDGRTLESVSDSIAAAASVLNHHDATAVPSEFLVRAAMCGEHCLIPAAVAAVSVSQNDASAGADGACTVASVHATVVRCCPPAAVASGSTALAAASSVPGWGGTVIDVGEGAEAAGAALAVALQLEPFGQQQLNSLHACFERLRGSIEAPAPFWISATEPVREALQDFNLHIHRLEDMRRQLELEVAGRRRTPRITVAWDHRRPRVPVRDEELRHFTVRRTFGTAYLNYCVVGKHLLELFQDDDSDWCGDDNVRPQRMMSADTQCFFGPDMTEEEASRKLEDFREWLVAGRERRARWAVSKLRELALGHLPVAELDRQCAAVRGLCEEEIVDKLADFQHIVSMHILR